MFIDSRELPADETIEADVCIVGAGAAGITIARELIGQDLRVLLLESGGLEHDAQTQDLYAGENVGGRYAEPDEMRLRYFGGTTNHWTGHCRPLDELDFITRPWVPHSGWPFERPELVSYYRRAENVCEVGPFGYESADWAGDGDGQPLPFPTDRILTSQYQRSPPTRFGEVYRADLSRASNVTTYLHANVVEIETDEAAKRVTALRVATLSGNEFRVSARLNVLAAGGIENARLLLLSDRAQRGGLGNGNDLVGRFFMDHRILRSGMLLPLIAPSATELYDFGRPRYGILTLPENILRGEKLVNLTIFLRWVPPEAAAGVTSLKTILGAVGDRTYPDELGSHLWNVITDIDDVAAATYRKILGRDRSPSFIEFHNRVEPIPNPESRVSLAAERDRLGLRRVRLDWLHGKSELRSIQRAHEIIGIEAGRLGLGRVRVDLDGPDPEWPQSWSVSGHHIGTTRMHRDPKQGVVDADCRMHGVANLFVAGSSVFPTSGASNPTLTVVALALRIADRIKVLHGGL